MHEQYGVSPSTLRQWVIRYNNTKSFDVEDNRTDKEKRLIELEKRVKQLEMENDILKQAALLLGKNNYGTRKIKVELETLGHKVSISSKGYKGISFRSWQRI